MSEQREALKEAIALRVALWRNGCDPEEDDMLSDDQIIQQDVYARKWQAAIASKPEAQPVAEVLMHECEKIIDASMSFMDSAAIGTELYTASPTVQAAVAIAYKLAAKTLLNGSFVHDEAPDARLAKAAAEVILALTPADAEKALEEQYMKVAIATWYASPSDNPEDACRAIVQRVIGE
jgi:hypothetical protein